MKRDKVYSHYLFIQRKKNRDNKNLNNAFNAFIKSIPYLKNNDTSITLSSLDKICQLLQCDISDVVEYKEP